MANPDVVQIRGAKSMRPANRNATVPQCPLCGGATHPYETCEAVLAVEYFENGKLKRLEKRDAWFPTPQR